MNASSSPVLTATEDRSLRLKAAALLLSLLIVVLAIGSYILYARGAFEQTRTVELRTDDASGVEVGMDVHFAGFPIGRITRISLGDDGYARIILSVPERDGKWLRVSSVFTLERGLVGGAKIRAHTGVLDDPPLPNGAERNLLTGDATAQIPFITAAAKELLDNLNALTKNVQGQGGALRVLMGNAGDRQRVMDGVQNANSLLTRLESVATHVDKTVLGQSGLVPQATALVNETTATVAQARGTLTQVSGALAQLSGTLTQVSGSLTRVDGILKDVKGVSASANEASVDLVALRSEVDQGLREVNALLASLQGKWPFESTQPSIQLP